MWTRLAWLFLVGSASTACGANTSVEDNEATGRVGATSDDDAQAMSDEDVSPDVTEDDEDVSPSATENDVGTAATDNDVGTDVTDDVTEGDVTPPVVERPVPSKHRSVAVACDHARPPGGVMYEGGACNADAECTDGENGRCLDLRGATCTYDACFADSECSTGGPCGCEEGFWSDANACLGGNCQVDADCGAEGYCSPTLGSCGNYAGVVAYYCRTPEDTCVEDSECADPNGGGGYCAFYPEVGYWACQYGQCVG